MPDPGQTLRYAVSACAVAGLKVTAPRRRMLELLAEPGIPQVVEPLIRKVSDECRVHPVTVYRFVALLEEKGIVHRLRLREHRAVVLACESLDYLICDRCGVVTRLQEPAGFRDWQEILAAETGFLLEHHWFEVSGICHGCQDPAESTLTSQDSSSSTTSTTDGHPC